MRADVARVLALASFLATAASASATLGCIESQPKGLDDPSSFEREETVAPNRVAPPSRATARTVRCGCDADGDLHVSAPAGSRVTRPEDAVHPAEAQIVLPDDAPPRPIRKTVSLGFIGDGKLTELPSRGHWASHDNLLPPHAHGHGASGYGPYGYGVSRGPGYAYGYGAGYPPPPMIVAPGYPPPYLPPQ